MRECVRCGSRVTGRVICPVCEIGDESPRADAVETKNLTVREAVQELAMQGYHPSAIAHHVGIPEDFVDEILGV